MASLQSQIKVDQIYTKGTEILVFHLPLSSSENVLNTRKHVIGC